MNEEDVREIVQDELVRIQREVAARSVAAADQFQAEWLEGCKPSDEDGPVVSKIKRILRGEPE